MNHRPQKLMMLALVLFFVQLFFLAQPVLGQNTDAAIDEAMAHLSEELGSTVNRVTSFWRWSEQVYADSGLGCGIPGKAYAATPNRAYLIVISYSGTDYEYRVSTDGTIMVLCEGGNPLYRSDATVVPVIPTAAPATEVDAGSVALPVSRWAIWAYMDGSDLLYLVNERGAQMVVKRPELPSEPPGTVLSGNNLQLAISRDSHYMLEAVRLADGSTLVGLYDFVTGDLTEVLHTAANEDVNLGWGGDGLSNVDGSPLIFDANSGMAAIGITLNDPSTTEWRVVIIDLASGMIVSQLLHRDLAFIMEGNDTENFLNTAQNGVYLPRPVYFDNGGGIHVQLVRMFAGGSSVNPAFVWYPNTNTARVSDYNRSSISIIPSNGAALFGYRDNNSPALPADGPFESQNAIGQGFPTADALTVQPLYINSSVFIFSPKWAGIGDKVVFQNSTTVSSMNWAIFDITNPLEPAVQLSSIYDNAQGVSDGVLAVSEAVEGFDVTLFSDTNQTVVWTAPPMNGDLVFVWVQPVGVAFDLSHIALNTWAYLPETSGGLPQPPAIATAVPAATTGTVYCPGTPPSLMSVGMKGRVTYTTGTPLNIRALPTTGSPVLSILPEGSEFNVVEGPQCANGYTWWQVLLSGNIYGWAAEGDMDDYFIEPSP